MVETRHQTENNHPHEDKKPESSAVVEEKQKESGESLKESPRAGSKREASEGTGSKEAGNEEPPAKKFKPDEGSEDESVKHTYQTGLFWAPVGVETSN